MSIFNFWPTERYKPDAFASFSPTRDLDLGTARALMWAAQLAYELDAHTSPDHIDKVKTILRLWNMELVQPVPIPGFPQVPMLALHLLPAVSRDALVIRGRGAIIVAFAGTDPPRIQDWLVNFAALPTGATGVSMGLSDAAAMFAPLLKPLVEPRGDLKLYVTGHSLGGSLGVAVAYALSQIGCNADAVYTYGMPRAGDPGFAADYDQRLGAHTYRFVHGDDLVPTVPPANFGAIKHQHVGWLIRCETGAKFSLSQRSADTKSNEPLDDNAILAGALAPADLIDRGLAASRTFTSGGGLVDISIAAQPPRIRHHLQDQYIASLTG
jgi:triacylglycerol lipase